jgi:hypothetical protein
MVWRDLDIHIVRSNPDHAAFFALGGEIATLLHPTKMHYRDEIVTATPGLPVGLYWGIYLGNERQGAWKIDIWTTDAEGFAPMQQFHHRLLQRLTPATRASILTIKAACWQHPEYRRAFSSADIYEAVLEHHVTGFAEFGQYLRERRGVNVT